MDSTCLERILIKARGVRRQPAVIARWPMTLRAQGGRSKRDLESLRWGK